MAKSFVNGEWVDDLPVTEGGQVALASQAVAASQSCVWDAVNSGGSLAALRLRYDVVMKLVEVMENNCDEFAEIDAAETGVPLFVAKQIPQGYGPAARAFLESAFHHLCEQYTETIPGRYGKPIVRCSVANSPALVIAPWNVPFGTILPKIFVAWLCGCSVVVKPSEFAPLGICAMVRKLTDAKLLPKNAIQVVIGGPEVGHALVVDPRVRCVQFTGSSATAIKVAAAGAAFLRPFHAECGGSNAAILFNGTDMDTAVRCVAMGMTTLNGQWCMGLTRVFVHRDQFDEFLHKFTTYMMHNLRVVDPEDPTALPHDESSILVGRLAFPAHRERLEATCTACSPKDVVLLGEFGGETTFRRPDAKLSSSYFQPRLLLNPDITAISSTELFGPVAGVIPFDSKEEAVVMANLATGQLASYIFGADADELYRIAPCLRTGMVMINSVNFCFEVADGHSEPQVDFVGTAGHGADGNGKALASFFTSTMWVGVNGPQAS